MTTNPTAWRVRSLLDEAQTLSTLDRLLLALRLLLGLGRSRPKPSFTTWNDLRGILPYPALGEDAQAWISRTRAEADSSRSR